MECQKPEDLILIRFVSLAVVYCLVSSVSYILVPTLLTCLIKEVDQDQECYVLQTTQSPDYLRELCVPVSSLPGRRSLRSAEQGDLVVPRVRLATAQRRSFAVVGPSFWNALPSRLRSELLALSLPLFHSRLKTILFD